MTGEFMKKYGLLGGLLRLREILESKPNPSSEELAELSGSHSQQEIGSICEWLTAYCRRGELLTRPGKGNLSRLFRKWPEGGGYSVYPVPSPISRISASAAYYMHHEFPFNPDQPYCQARLRLLDWLIEQLEGGSKD